MNKFDCEYDVGGAPVIYNEAQDTPYNPLNRPEIHYKKPIIALVGFIFVVTIITVISFAFLSNIISDITGLPEGICTLLVPSLFGLIYLSMILKRALIWLVHLYQNKASDKTRLKCVFEPSCSEYMILSIKKYGSLLGVIKGIHRLFRCHPPNGGLDLP